MKNLRIIIISILIFIFVMPNLNSATIRVKTWGYSFGMKIGASILSSDISNIEALNTCCTKYTTSSDFGADMNISFKYFLTQMSEFEILFSRNSNSVDIIENEDWYINLNGNPTTGNISYNFNTILKSNSIGLNYKFNLSKFFHFKSGVNYNILTTQTFTSNEKLEKPDNRGVFLNNRRIRNENSGEIDFINSDFVDLYLGLGVNIYFNYKQTYGLNINLGYHFGLNNLMKDKTQYMNINKFRIGLSYFYDFSKLISDNPVVPAKENAY